MNLKFAIYRLPLCVFAPFASWRENLPTLRSAGKVIQLPSPAEKIHSELLVAPTLPAKVNDQVPGGDCLCESPARCLSPRKSQLSTALLQRIDVRGYLY